MKSKALLLAGLLALQFSLLGIIDYNLAFAQTADNGIDLVDIHTHPLRVNVGETFIIGATAVNNSPTSIFFHGLCESPLSVQFDANVKIQSGVACQGFSIVELKPGESAVVTGPASGTTYLASSAGSTNAKVVFSYSLPNEEKKAITKSIEFSIFEQDNSETRPVELGLPFELKINQAGLIESENLRVEFVNVTEDSRCPSDVVCVWQGQATAFFEATLGNDDVYTFELTTGDSTKSIGQYSVALDSLQPYPKSTEKIEPSDYVAEITVKKISSKTVLVKATSDSQDLRGLVAGWNLEKGRGGAVLYVQDSKSPGQIFLQFDAAQAKCIEFDECIDGAITRVSDDSFKTGEQVHIEAGDTLSLTIGDRKYMMDVVGIKTKPWDTNTVSLKEGERSGPLLVTKIYPDHVEGLNFLDYPVAREEGFPITLNVGDKASNGCTISLTLVRIDGDKAVFTQWIDYNRPCPICHHN